MLRRVLLNDRQRVIARRNELGLVDIHRSVRPWKGFAGVGVRSAAAGGEELEGAPEAWRSTTPQMGCLSGYASAISKSHRTQRSAGTGCQFRLL